jgi:type II secretory pathway component GspD/PulD (secretin)
VQAIKRLIFRMAVALLLAWPALAIALKVGSVSVSRSGSGAILKIATDGTAAPTVSMVDGNKALIVVPGGERSAMASLKVNAGIVKGIRFGSEGGDLHIVADLKQAGVASLGSISSTGFQVKVSAAAAKAAAPKAPPAKAAADAAPAADDAADVASLNPASAGYTYRIVDLSLGGDDQEGQLVISSDGPASYKSSLKDDGKLLSLTFRNSSLAWAGDGAKLADSSVAGVSVRQASEGGESLVKVDIRLKQKLAYNLKRDQNQLVVQLSRPEEAPKAPRKGDIKTLVSIDVEDADIVVVLKALCQQAGFEYQFTKTILAIVPPDNLVTLRVKDRPFDEVISTILSQVTASYMQQGNVLYIGSTAEIADKKTRLPLVSRFYEPKYMSLLQLTNVLLLHFPREPEHTTYTNMLKPDPSQTTRFMLVGTAEDVSAAMNAIALYDVPESGDEGASADGEGGGSQKTQIFHLQYLDTNSNGLITAAINQLYPAGETPAAIYQDIISRTLVVTTSLKYLRKIEKVLARIDVKPRQVNIEGKIVEIDQGLSQQLGIDWTANQQSASPNLSGAFNTGLPSDFTSQLQYATVQNGFNINARIQALVSTNKADLVSSPNITTNDNQSASISTSDTQIEVQTTTTIVNGTVTSTQNFQPFNIPLVLTVLPRISPQDRRILMNITFDLTSASGAPATTGAPPPTSAQRATTNVSVNSGDTSVIGGLVRQSNTEQERKVPVLGDIPLLGLLFKFNTVSKDKKEVIIFITPTIVED